jgi:hypothetical protein
MVPTAGPSCDPAIVTADEHRGSPGDGIHDNPSYDSEEKAEQPDPGHDEGPPTR